MAALVLTVFALFLLYPPVILADTTLLPALKFEAEPRNALIRGLIDPEVDRRQTSYCPAPMYGCEYRYCCPNSNYPCCRGGTCCRPNTYCVLASNGIIGCCPVGRICSGPVNDPTTIHYTYTTTSTSTSTHIPTPTYTVTYPIVPSPTDTTTPSTSSSPTTLPVDFPTVKTPTTTSLTSSFAGNSTSSPSPSGQSTTINDLPSFANIATRTTENVVVLFAASTFCITFYTMII